MWVGARSYCRQRRCGEQNRTYSSAVLAKFHGIPFYVAAAPQTTRPGLARIGRGDPIEQRAASEVTGVAGSFGAVQWVLKMHRFTTRRVTSQPRLISGWH